ncbi:hypothetical protein AN958_05647 [Leucoagaricus sp. SymC.cos]|nr:hypothetical protein AN958_05647 [Leucoagaricus sp. SymC.cos]
MRFYFASLVFASAYLLNAATAVELAVGSEPASYGQPQIPNDHQLRGLLEGRRQGCNTGSGVCSNTGSCCPVGGDCCNTGSCCNSGHWCYTSRVCCPNGQVGCAEKGCCPKDSQCCGSSTLQRTYCYKSKTDDKIKCCPNGQRCN